jgi:hypothetical protein
MPDTDYAHLVQSHFDKLLTRGLDTYGPQHTRMWMASLDTRTGQYPENDTRPPHIGKRVYRNIDAPRGCSLYWDQPSIVAAHALTTLTQNSTYSQAADDYIRDFLARCVASNGIFLWGNHYFYDAFIDKTVKFPGSGIPYPVDFATETGDYHEIRPLPPAWGAFWRVDPVATARAIRAAALGHIANSATGQFNRHADNRHGCAFLEHGGTLIQAVAWLHARQPCPDLLDLARATARYSFTHRHPSTGLLENNPAESRWDKHTSTTEVGLWAGCLLQAHQWISQPEWAQMAQAALKPWLLHGYDPAARKYYGRLRVSDATPIFDPPATDYEPGNHADLWRPLFPAHDYPMSFAQAVLALYRLTGDPDCQQSCLRWRNAIQASLPARAGLGGYAEHYGRCIHFLLDCAQAFPDQSDRFLPLAHRLAREAVETLFEHGMFRGHPGEHRYDAVDGVGFLALSLLWLDSGSRPDPLGMGW